MSHILSLFQSNRPIEALNNDNDYLQTIPKGKLISDFIEKINTNEQAKIQMIALYGEWGSGKTTLMKWIENNLKEKSNTFETVFFESWLHEKDENMALSLLDVITKSNPNLKQDASLKVLYASLGAIVKGLTKSITLDLFGLKINTEKIIVEVENKHKELDNNETFYEKLETFKSNYFDLENKLLKTNQTLVVFLDDLDRCEPQNVLELLSVIKLFFTYGKRTVFVCGIDKDAVNKAINHKYHDTIKANEYLEKVFDVSFNMPKKDIQKMLSYYLANENIADMPKLNNNEIKELSNFLTSINFTNSRHIKKMLNKYILLMYFNENKQNNLIPDFNIELYRILVMFIIILYEFEFEKYLVVKNYDAKIERYIETIKSSTESYNQRRFKATQYLFKDPNIIIEETRHQQSANTFIAAFCTLFSPLINDYSPIEIGNVGPYYVQFEKSNCILSKFTVYMNKYLNSSVFRNTTFDDYKLWAIFDMAELYL